MFGTGQLPKFEDDAYHVSGDNFPDPHRRGRATNLHAGEVLDADTLPRRYTAFTPASVGRLAPPVATPAASFASTSSTKLRWSSLLPEESDEELESMTAEAEYLLQQLGLPYRVISLCTGDLGFSARQTYDIEVWLPSYNATRRSAPAPTVATSRPAAPTSSIAIPRTSRVRDTCTPLTVPVCRLVVLHGCHSGELPERRRHHHDPPRVLRPLTWAASRRSSRSRKLAA